MENVGQPLENISESLENTEQTPLTIEKPKTPRKKKEKDSAAQLESLKRGRERLAEKRKQRLEAKVNEPLNKLDDVYNMCNEVMKKLEEQSKASIIHAERKNIEKTTVVKVQEEVKTLIPSPVKRVRFFV